MHPSNDRLSPRSLAELALIVSRFAPYFRDEASKPSPELLRSFWQSARSLEQRWMKSLAVAREAGPSDIFQLEAISQRILLCDIVIRLWGTMLASHETRQAGKDLAMLARNVVHGFYRVRNELLAGMLTVPCAHNQRLMEIDRLRRRCERWTDLLIGPVAVLSGCFEFTYDSERARDFGQDGLDAVSDAGPDSYEHLVSAGLLLTFNRHLSDAPIDEPEVPELMHAILASLPRRAFHSDGTLRTSLERRIIADRLRLERRETIDLNNVSHARMPPKSIKPGGDFFLRPPRDT